MLTTVPLLKYLIILGLSTGLVLLLTPTFIRLAPLLGLIDHPGERRIHKKPIPVGAGIVIFISFNIACYLLYQSIWPGFTGKLDFDWWQAFFISSSMLVFLGLIDDRYGISALTKLAGQATATVCLYLLSGYQLNLLNVDFGFWGSLAFVMLWTVAIINAFNLIDGLDGLCGGLALISGLGLGCVFIFRGFPGDTLVCLALAGGCLGFLRYNFHPAKVFLGDTGSMFLGFTLASISLHAGGKGSFFILLAAPFFVAGIPIIDTLLAIWRRSIRKILAHRNGNPAVKVMQADREHLHHRLLDYGLKQHHVAYTLYIANAAIVAFGLVYFIYREISTGLFLITLIIALYLLIRYVLHIELWETSRLLIQSGDRAVISRFSLMFYPLFDLAWMAAMLWLSGFITLQGESPFRSMGDWAVHVPIWITPVFVLLFIFNTYIKVWQNSFFSDYLWLSLAVIVGCLLSLGLLFVFSNTSKFLILNQLLLFCFLTLFGIVGVRVPHHFLREWGISAKNPRHPVAHSKLLIYGAGAHGGLYLRKRHLKYGNELGGICIVGFIDDDLRLKNQYTYGLKVLGDIHELKKIIEQYQITDIILTTTISEINFLTLKKISAETGIKVFEWKTYKTQIIPANVI